MKTIIRILSVLCLCHCVNSHAQKSKHFFKAPGSPVNPKVKIAWDRGYDAEALADFCKKIAKKYPRLAKWQTIGRSYQGRKIIALTITDFNKGNPTDKPGIYIQGNIHGNEIGSGESTLYIAWYLTEAFNDSKYIQDLLAEKVFYIIPSLNPDARDYYIHKASSIRQPRNTLLPFDSDGDGKSYEDGCDDLDKDGSITQMRFKDPFGAYVIDPQSPQIMQLLPSDSIISQPGKIPKSKNPSKDHYTVVTEGGIDNDHDGKVDEDGIISDSTAYHSDAEKEKFIEFDPNRNWGWSWQPNSKDRTLEFAFSLVETRTARDFILQRPNIAIGFSIHMGGNFFSSGSAYQKLYLTDDCKFSSDSASINSEKTLSSDSLIYSALNEFVTKIFPYPKEYVNDYTIPGRESDWMFGRRGFYSYTLEMGDFSVGLTQKSYSKEVDENYAYLDYLLSQDGYVPWHEVNHPLYGKVEVGGLNKHFGVIPSGFAFEDEMHRVMSFVVHTSYETPKLQIMKVEINDKGNGIDSVIAVIANERLMPTHSAQDIRHRIQQPDTVKLDTDGIIIKNSENFGNSDKIVIPNILGHSDKTVYWLVKKKSQKYRVSVKSNKGGYVSASAN